LIKECGEFFLLCFLECSSYATDGVEMRARLISWITGFIDGLFEVIFAK
jgi:hypothetical protein